MLQGSTMIDDGAPMKMLTHLDIIFSSFYELMSYYLYSNIDLDLCILLQPFDTNPLDSQEEEVGWFMLNLLFYHVFVCIVFNIFLFFPYGLNQIFESIEHDEALGIVLEEVRMNNILISCFSSKLLEPDYVIGIET